MKKVLFIIPFMVLFCSSGLLAANISADDVKEAEKIITDGAKPEKGELKETVDLVYEYFVYSKENGSFKAADLALSYLMPYTASLDAKQIDVIKKSKLLQPLIAKQLTSETFDVERFKTLLKDYLTNYKNKAEVTEKSSTADLLKLTLKEFIFDVNNFLFDFESPLGKTAMDLLYDSSGIVEYFKLKIEMCGTQQKTLRTGLYGAVMVLNEISKSFAQNYIAQNAAVSEKFIETELMITKERSVNAEFDKICVKATVNDKTLLKEADAIKDIAL